MFELQDSKGNRFRLSRGGQSQEHAALALEGNPLQVKRLLKFCDSIALVRAYSFFFASSTKRPATKANPTHAKRHRNTLLITRGNNQQVTASGIPKAQRPAARTASPEERLFQAIANGELQLAHTHKVAVFDVARAEKELGLTRSKLLSDCNALVLEKKRLASRGQFSPWGLIASSSTTGNERKMMNARARIISLNYQRFCASLPNVKKVDGAAQQQSHTGPQGSAEIQARDMLKALGFATTKVSTTQYQRAQQQLEQIWKNKNLYKQAREFSSDYAKTHKSTEHAADKELATYELTLCLLLCHDQPIHALASPSPEQINLFGRYKTLGRGFWKAAETARSIETERETIASRPTFDKLAQEDNEERERTTPPTALTFIEITLLDEKGEPVANEPYWVLDPEGNEHTGNLDGSGFARIDNIKPGNCQVAFPEIEGSGISQCRADMDCCTPPPPVLTFIEVKLVDDQGNPVANEDYVIECPEGNTYEGKTNTEGIARVDDILEGNCKVSFPNFSPDSVQVCESGGDCCKPANNISDTPKKQNSGSSTEELREEAADSARAEKNTPRLNEPTERSDSPLQTEAIPSKEKSALKEDNYQLVKLLPEISNYKQFVNLESSPLDPTQGRDLPVEAHLNEPIAGITVYFLLDPHEDNNKALPPRMQGTGLADSMKGEQKVITATTDANGVASTKIKLSTFGGDKFKVIASLTPQTDASGEGSLSTDWITVWRRLWYQQTHHKDLIPPSMATAIKQFKNVYIDFVEEPSVTHNIGKNGKVIIGSHNTAQYHALHRNDHPGQSVHILFCDEQIDGSPHKVREKSATFTEHTGNINVTGGEALIMFDPPLGGGKLLVSATWENVKTGATGILTNDSSLTDDNIGLCEYKNEDYVQITLPLNAKPSKEEPVSVTIEVNLASGPWGGDGGTAPHNLICIDHDDTIHTMCVMHELGHLINMGPLEERVECPDGFKYTDHTKSYESNGAHCYSGGRFNAVENEGEDGTCIMYHQLNYDCTLDFCDECAPFIKAMTLKQYKDLAK